MPGRYFASDDEQDAAPSSERLQVTTTTTAKKLHVGWIMPPFFHELPIDTDDPDEAATRLVDLTRTVLPEHPERQQMAFAMMHASQLDHFRSAGAVYAGFCLLDMEGRPSTASVCVYQLPTEGAPVEDTLTEIKSALERKYRDDDIQIMELPCGQALARIAAAPFLLPAEMSPTGTGVVVDRGLIHCYVPLPDTQEMLLFELSTPSMEDWELYSELFAEIVRTIDWATDQEIAEYARLNQESRVAQQPDQAQVQQVYARSSRVLDALAVRGRMDDEHSEVTATTCEGCWAKGLRSPCSTTHRCASTRWTSTGCARHWSGWPPTCGRRAGARSVTPRRWWWSRPATTRRPG